VQRLTADRGDVQGAILSGRDRKQYWPPGNGGDTAIRDCRSEFWAGVTRSMFDSMTIPVLMSH
jgi:hypothetical protein